MEYAGKWEEICCRPQAPPDSLMWLQDFLWKSEAFWDGAEVLFFFCNRAFGVWTGCMGLHRGVRPPATLGVVVKLSPLTCGDTLAAGCFFEEWGSVAAGERAQQLHRAGDFPYGWGELITHLRLCLWKTSASHLWNARPLIHNGIPAVFSWAVISLIQTRCPGSRDKQWAIISAISSLLCSQRAAMH